MNPRGPSPAVIAAAIVGILTSIFFILMSLLAMVGISVMGHAPNADAKLPPGIQSGVLLMMALFVLVSVFGLVTCVYVLRLKNWARISIIVWGCVMGGISALALIGVLLAPVALPPGSPVNVTAMKIIIQVVYGIPLFIGGWWVVLFNRPGVRAQFEQPPLHQEPAIPGYVSGMDPAAYSMGPAPEVPLVLPAVPARPPRPPLPLTVLSYYFLVTAGLSLLIFPFLKLPKTPILFGHIVRGPIGLAALLLPAALLVIGSIGVLTLQRWGYWLLLILQFFSMISSAFTLLSANFESNMREIMSQMHLPQTVATPPFTQTRSFAIISLLPIFVFIWLLLYYHTRFEEACAAKNALKRS